MRYLSSALGARCPPSQRRREINNDQVGQLVLSHVPLECMPVLYGEKLVCVDIIEIYILVILFATIEISARFNAAISLELMVE